MRQLFSLLVALISLPAMAVVVPTGAAVEANGAWIDIFFSGTGTILPTNTFFQDKGFSFGLGTNNSLGGTASMTLTSLGYDTTGTAITNGRSVIVTRELRLPYHNETNIDCTISGSGMMVRFAMSEYVCGSDSNLFLTIGANLWSNSTASSFTVTNSSAVVYGRTIGNWSWANWDRVTNTSFTLRCTAFSQWGKNSSPMAAVKFKAVDQHSHTVTTTVTKMTIDASIPDAVPVSEYVGTMDATTLTQGDVLTCDFTAYPWIGTNTLDTSDGVNVEGSPYWHSYHLLCDKTGAYCPAIAMVNASTGTVNSVCWTNGQIPTVAFASINQAANALAITNNSKFGHNDSGGGIIYLQGGNHSFSGTDASAPTTRGLTWLTIDTVPGFTSTIINGTGPGNVNSLTKLQNTVIASPDAFTFSAVSNIWFHKCVINETNSSGDWIDGAGNYFFTDCTVNQNDMGFAQQGSQKQTYNLIRGNTVGGNSRPWQGFNVIGNYLNTYTNVGTLISDGLSSIPWPLQDPIIAYNKFMNLDYHGSSFFSLGSGSFVISNGFAIVQNVFENVSSNGLLPGVLIGLHSDSTTGIGMTNGIVWYNDFLGERSNIAYNDEAGSAARYTVLFSCKGNIFDNFNIKSDTFPGNGANGGRIGNWPAVWGVGFSGNFSIEQTNTPTAAAATFMHEFAGLNSYQPNINAITQPPAGTPNPTNYCKFTVLGAWYGLVLEGIGNGDYRLQASSPANNVQCNEILLPFDIRGVPRLLPGTAGAYTSAPNTQPSMVFGSPR